MCYPETVSGVRVRLHLGLFLVGGGSGKSHGLVIVMSDLGYCIFA